VSFKTIMTTRSCFTIQHQNCKTKTKTAVCKTIRPRPRPQLARPRSIPIFWCQTGLVLRPTVSDHITGAYTTYARPLVEHDSAWSPYIVKDFTTIESVQRRFYQALIIYNLSYTERLQRISLPSLELRRLYVDLIYCYKIIFGMVDLTTSDFFQWAPCTSTRGHSFKLHKNSCSARVRSTLFSERVVNGWNGLPANVDFSSLRSFTRTVKLADLSLF